MNIFFIFSCLALLSWSGSDLFSKMGTNEKDKHSHWKVVFAVGFIMGIHFIITLIGGKIIDSTVGADAVNDTIKSLVYTDFKFIDFINYLPVAALYILAMVLGYIGLRYIELSVSSPICNASGSLAFILCLLFGLINKNDLTITVAIGVTLITIGIVTLGFVDSQEDISLKEERRKDSNRKYSKSVLAFLLPIAYLIIDALGTVGDEYIFTLTGEDGKDIITDYAANSAFEFTFFILATFAFIYLKVKKQKVFSGNKYLMFGGLCETIGQIFYMAVMFSDFDEGMVIISAYCVLSLVWSRIFLKEKLSVLHYLAIIYTTVGIVLLG